MTRWLPPNPWRLLRQIRDTQLATQAQLLRMERMTMAGQAEIEAEIQAVRASEQALLKRTTENAARLQTIIDTLQGQASPDLQPQIDELKSLQQDMDAAAQAAPTPAP